MSPIPSPTANEDKNKFISRCISTLSKIENGKTPEQISAMCYNTWEHEMGEDITDLKVKTKMESNITTTGRKDTVNSLDAVPLFKVGTWNGDAGPMTFTLNDLFKIKDNTNALLNAGIISTPATPGHKWSGQDTGALGWLKRTFILGNQMFGDFSDVTKEAYEKVLTRQYKKTSPFIQKGFIHPDTKKPIDGFIIREVAFEGLEIPAMKGNGNIMYSEKCNDVFCVSFAEQILQEEKQMNVWTLKDIEVTWPCCIVEVQKFMEEKKITEINQEDLAELMSDIKRQKVREKFQENIVDKKECPPGFEWNEVKGICFVSGQTEVKAEEQITCPKGYKYDKDAGRCIIVVTKEQPATTPTIPAAAAATETNSNKLEKKMNELTDEEKATLKSEYDKLPDEGKKKFETMQEDQRPPKGWFDSCVSAVSGKAENPEALCGWIYAHQMGPAAKAEAEATRASEQQVAQAQKLSEEKLATEKKNNELIVRIKELEKDKMKQVFNEFKEKERDILIPALDPYIDSLYMYFNEKNDIVKFAEKDENILDLFIGFLKNFANSKRVIFSELTKSYNPKEELEQEGMKMEEIKFSEEQVKEANKEWNEKYSEELAKSEGPVDVINGDIATLSSQISFSEKIPIKEAQVKAIKILRKK